MFEWRIHSIEKKKGGKNDPHGTVPGLELNAMFNFETPSLYPPPLKKSTLFEQIRKCKRNRIRFSFAVYLCQRKFVVQKSSSIDLSHYEALKKNNEALRQKLDELLKTTNELQDAVRDSFAEEGFRGSTAETGINDKQLPVCQFGTQVACDARGRKERQ
ncbi:hypothetical protein CEXT_196481 [Caerostris extrusa]|uniref:Uncharacterized protein n=1 Tax=Caerostris extrusa TaxID=172846 RepID=A0AAV4MQT7_CAEEX|nr:hypothetical protein CEXT_196481 [Caerostris extrusa]